MASAEGAMAAARVVFVTMCMLAAAADFVTGQSLCTVVRPEPGLSEVAQAAAAGARTASSGPARAYSSSAQCLDRPHESSEPPATSRGTGPGILAVTGITPGAGGRMHYSVGSTAFLELRGWGLLGTGMVGRGGEYDSHLVGGAAIVPLFSLGRLRVSGFAGYGAYGEKGPTGIERDAQGPLYGGMVRLRVGPVLLAAIAQDLTGKYGGTDVDSPFRFHARRFALGVGF